MIDEWNSLKQNFVHHMDDDFQTQNGIADIYEMIGAMNRYIERDQVSKQIIDMYMTDLERKLYIFGVEDILETQDDLLDEEIDALIEERNQARQDKDFEKADAIRDQLREQGIILEDTAQGIRWKREQL